MKEIDASDSTFKDLIEGRNMYAGQIYNLSATAEKSKIVSLIARLAIAKT